ncbi:MAG TPA: proton-conducting transporter membrane subunit, partial [Chroococcales cyanobacterium]
ALIAGPVLCALIGFAARRYSVIRVMTWLTAVLVSVSAGALLYHGPGDYTLSFEHLGTVVEGIEWLLLLYFGYLAIRFRSFWVGTFTLMQGVLLAFTMFNFKGHEVTPTFFVDPLSTILVLVVSIIGSLISLYALEYMKDAKNNPRFFLFFLGFLGVMNGAVLSNDLAMFALFWEFTTLCCFYLIFHEETAEATKSALRALKLTLIGGVALSAAVPYSLFAFGTTSMQEIINNHSTVGLALIPIAFIVLAALTKSAQMPFQSWLLGAMVAPTPVSALLHSSTMVNLGVYTLLRFSPAIADASLLKTAVMIVGGLSFTVTAFLAITQSNAKRVLAYSTIGNLGLIAFCSAIGNGIGLVAGILLLVFHAISKALLFLSVGLVQHEFHSREIECMTGLNRKKPFLATLMLIGMFTMMLPPFGAFASKWLVIEGSHSYPLFMLLVIAGSALTVIYYTRWMGTILQGEPNEKAAVAKETWSPYYRWPLTILASAAILFGLLIAPITQRMVIPAIEGISPAALAESTLEATVPGLNALAPFGGLPIGVIYAVLLLLIALYVYLKNHTVFVPNQAYMCGEDFENNMVLTGFQLKAEKVEGKTTVVVNAIAIFTLMVLLIGVFVVR